MTLWHRQGRNTVGALAQPFRRGNGDASIASLPTTLRGRVGNLVFQTHIAHGFNRGRLGKVGISTMFFQSYWSGISIHIAHGFNRGTGGGYDVLESYSHTPVAIFQPCHITPIFPTMVETRCSRLHTAPRSGHDVMAPPGSEYGCTA